MADFIKVGTTRINLDKVVEVREFGDSITIWFEQGTSQFAGAEAKLFLAAIDDDDDTFDANTRWAVKEPGLGICPDCGVLIDQETELCPKCGVCYAC